MTWRLAAFTSNKWHEIFPMPLRSWSSDVIFFGLGDQDLYLYGLNLDIKASIDV